MAGIILEKLTEERVRVLRALTSQIQKLPRALSGRDRAPVNRWFLDTLPAAWRVHVRHRDVFAVGPRPEEVDFVCHHEGWLAAVVAGLLRRLLHGHYPLLGPKTIIERCVEKSTRRMGAVTGTFIT